MTPSAPTAPRWTDERINLSALALAADWQHVSTTLWADEYQRDGDVLMMRFGDDGAMTLATWQRLGGLTLRTPSPSKLTGWLR